MLECDIAASMMIEEDNDDDVAAGREWAKQWFMMSGHNFPAVTTTPALRWLHACRRGGGVVGYLPHFFLGGVQV